MSFFRLRVLNTFLLFLIGIIAGFILKDRFYPQVPKPQPYAAEYKPAYEAAPDPETESPGEEPADEEILEEPAPKAAPAPRPSVAAETLADARNGNGDSPIVIEPAPAPRAPKAGAVLGVRDEFFRNPSVYAGRELEMDLQMITAKKSSGGWRLNFVHTGPDKRIDYLYAEAGQGLLGEKPDLRIGYVYNVRFLCEKGETASGNVISAVSPTGDKADWATGLSAVE